MHDRRNRVLRFAAITIIFRLQYRQSTGTLGGTSLLSLSTASNMDPIVHELKEKTPPVFLMISFSSPTYLHTTNPPRNTRRKRMKEKQKTSQCNGPACSPTRLGHMRNWVGRTGVEGVWDVDTPLRRPLLLASPDELAR